MRISDHAGGLRSRYISVPINKVGVQCKKKKNEHDYYFVEDKLKLWFLNDRDRARLENEQGNRVEVGCPVLLHCKNKSVVLLTAELLP